MSTLLEQVLTATYTRKYMTTYDRAIADGHGPDHASHEASKAAWMARAEREHHEAQNASRRRAQ
jgi:hypothetical protein